MNMELFKTAEHGSSVRTEVVAGITTFLTMAYIIFVNPSILSSTGMDVKALIAVTCIVSGIASLATGIFANAPVAMAPGMGLNGFFAFTLVKAADPEVTWQTALGAVFISGVFFLILTLVGLRKRLVEAIPKPLIAAIGVGIGLFITFMGLQNLGIIVADPNTLVTSAQPNKTILIGLAGLLVMVVMEMKKIPGALLSGIAFATILGACFGELPTRDESATLEITKIAFQLDIIGALRLSLLPGIFTLMFIDMFDSVGTLLAVAPDAGLVDRDGRIKSLDRLLAIDAIATMFGALCGTSTTTAYIESAAGIEQGGRTGLTAVTTGVLFLAATALVPVVGLVPGYATAPALIMVGLFMMKGITKIEFSNMEYGLPAFVIIVMIALSYSISTGLAFGFIVYSLIQVLAGKITEVKISMWIITGLSTIYFCV